MGHSVIWSVVQLVTWSHSIGPLIFQSFSHSTNNHCTSVSVPKALLGVGHAAVIKKKFTGSTLLGKTDVKQAITAKGDEWGSLR